MAQTGTHTHHPDRIAVVSPIAGHIFWEWSRQKNEVVFLPCRFLFLPADTATCENAQADSHRPHGDRVANLEETASRERT